MSKLLLFLLPILLLQCKSKDQMSSLEKEKPNETVLMEDKSGDDLYKTDQVELRLQPKVKAQRIITSFKKYGLELKCMKDLKENLVVLAFDDEAISREELVSFLDNEVGVLHCKQTKGCLKEEKE